MVGPLKWFMAVLAIAALVLAVYSARPGDSLSEEALDFARADLDGDEKAEEYTLHQGKLTVTEDGETLWTSPEEWRVDDYLLGDVTHDGVPDLTLSLWKEGSFGEVKPFWHTGEDRSYKNHLFVLNLKDGEMKDVWCSSNLDRPIATFCLDDTDGDKQNELVVTEGAYRQVRGETYVLDTAAPTKTTVWEWQDWGFTQVK